MLWLKSGLSNGNAKPVVVVGTVQSVSIIPTANRDAVRHHFRQSGSNYARTPTQSWCTSWNVVITIDDSLDWLNTLPLLLPLPYCESPRLMSHRFLICVGTPRKPVWELWGLGQHHCCDLVLIIDLWLCRTLTKFLQLAFPCSCNAFQVSKFFLEGPSYLLRNLYAFCNIGRSIGHMLLQMD